MILSMTNTSEYLDSRLFYKIALRMILLKLKNVYWNYFSIFYKTKIILANTKNENESSKIIPKSIHLGKCRCGGGDGEKERVDSGASKIKSPVLCL